MPADKWLLSVCDRLLRVFWRAPWAIAWICDLSLEWIPEIVWYQTEWIQFQSRRNQTRHCVMPLRDVLVIRLALWSPHPPTTVHVSCWPTAIVNTPPPSHISNLPTFFIHVDIHQTTLRHIYHNKPFYSDAICCSLLGPLLVLILSCVVYLQGGVLMLCWGWRMSGEDGGEALGPRFPIPGSDSTQGLLGAFPDGGDPPCKLNYVDFWPACLHAEEGFTQVQFERFEYVCLILFMPYSTE